MNKEELNEMLLQDLARYGGVSPSFKDWLVNNESWFIFHLVKHVRYQEYHQNKSGWHKFAYLYHWYIYKKLSLRLHITIYPGTVLGGLRIYHAGGFIHIGSNCKIGHNCTILPGVVFGNKHEEETTGMTIVGDNCYFGLDAKIFGPLTIGDNVTVGANAVVVNNIPDNCVVGGVPARILKRKI